MKRTSLPQYAIDNASILFLAQIRKDHTNSFRFSMTLTEDICPDTLQMAVNRIYRRFPTVIAGFRSGFFRYLQVPVTSAPQVLPDPGYLHTMPTEELQNCAFRVYYAGKNVSIEAFHALTDGYGAIACFTTLIAEYLKLKYGVSIPVMNTLVDPDQQPMPYEVEDAFLTYAQKESTHLPSRYSYQLPGNDRPSDKIHTSTYSVPIQKMLDTAHRYGISINTLISSVMASSVMDIQQKHASGKLLPVRVMVPANLRRMFPSRTLRNFSYYALPAMEPQDVQKPLTELFHSFADQIHTQLEQKYLRAIISYNVKMQNSWYFRMIPLRIKTALMRFICNFFGETNSSITVTNLGTVVLPEEMRSYITHMDVTLTPRMRSPYGCAILSYNDTLTINLSRFPQEPELDNVFFQKLDTLLGHGESDT